MIPDEIKLIQEYPFDFLWDFFWNSENKICDSTSQKIKKEYNESKYKFEILKEKKSLETDLDFYLKSAKPIYNTHEWGFPKGRKQHCNGIESDILCALREFNEETEIDNSEIKILENIKPIEENLTGTNGIKYKHIYYLAEFNGQNININTEIGNTNSEIGDIGFFTYEQAINMIRDYHVDKKRILKCIVNYYKDILTKSEKKTNSNDWT